MRAFRISALAFASAVSMLAQPSIAQTLYRYNGTMLFDGRFGPIARVQERVRDALAACRLPDKVTVDGYFGPGLRKALIALSRCEEFAPALAEDAEGREGALTAAYWAVLMKEAAPGIDARAFTIMLTFERTDFTHMEWNFCQSRPIYAPQEGRLVCYSNDRTSYVTWGPNGATAGGGREVQHILGAIDGIDPTRIDMSFGAEAGAVRRMLRLKDRDHARSLETYLCGVWADKARRAAWMAGFGQIGELALTRATFEDLYRSGDLDGGKIDAFFRAYAANGLAPSEIDYAFFKDRAAHTTVNYVAIKAAIAAALAGDASLPHWRVRRAIALAVRPGNADQRIVRLERDMTFYIEDAGDQLSLEERAAWDDRDNKRVRVSDLGLSDARSAGSYAPGPALPAPSGPWDALTPAEIAACPRAVLDTVSPRARKGR